VVDRTTDFEIQAIEVALNHYFVDCNHYPDTDIGLNALISGHGEARMERPLPLRISPMERRYIR
jgi:hypothetical protein